MRDAVFDGLSGFEILEDGVLDGLCGFDIVDDCVSELKGVSEPQKGKQALNLIFFPH